MPRCAYTALAMVCCCAGTGMIRSSFSYVTPVCNYASLHSHGSVRTHTITTLLPQSQIHALNIFNLNSFHTMREDNTLTPCSTISCHLETCKSHRCYSSSRKRWPRAASSRGVWFVYSLRKGGSCTLKDVHFPGSTNWFTVYWLFRGDWH